MNVNDRIKETWTGTGLTTTISLLGAAANYAPFLSTQIPVGTVDIPVCVSDNAGNWEIADYTLTSASLLTRQSTIWGSSNGGAAVTFPSGTKEVFCAVPAARVMKFMRATTTVFSTVIPLMTPGSRYMTPSSVTAPITFTLAANPVQGALVYTSLVADGTSAITMPSGFKEWGGSSGYDNRAGIKNQLQFFYDGVDYWYSWSQAVGAVASASSVTMTGPTGGAVSVASSNFSIGVSPVGGAITGTVVVTPSDNGGGGSFSPTTVSLTTASPTATFTYTPSATAGARTISVTNNGSLANPSNITYTSTAATAATGVTMAGPTGGTVSTASTNFSIGVTPVGGTISGTVVVTPSDGGGGGSFTPTTVSLTTAAPTATFTYTPSATAGARTISVTNNGGLTNPSNITYTSTAATAALRLTALNYLVESGTGPYTYTAVANSASPFNTQGGISNKVLPASTDGSFAVTTTAGEIMLAVATSSTASGVENYQTVPLALWVNGRTNYGIFVNGTNTTPTATVAVQASDIMRIRRSGTNWICEVARSATPTVFTTVYTLTGASTRQLVFEVNHSNPQAIIDNPTGVGMV